MSEPWNPTSGPRFNVKPIHLRPGPVDGIPASLDAGSAQGRTPREVEMLRRKLGKAAFAAEAAQAEPAGDEAPASDNAVRGGTVPRGWGGMADKLGLGRVYLAIHRSRVANQPGTALEKMPCRKLNP